jgi:predicted phosphoribosyltransferase
MGRLIEETPFRNKRHLFKDRRAAGELLGEKLLDYSNSPSLVLAIPSGGLPVGLAIADKTGLPFDVIIARKLQIPYEREAGFGALGPDGEVALNEALLQHVPLTKEEIDSEIERTMAVIKRRTELFRAGRPLRNMKDRNVIIVDDGLASGYTMRAAVEHAKKNTPKKIIVAVPTASARTVQSLVQEVDELVCLNIRTGRSFAVADAYTEWHDLRDSEVLSLLELYRRSLPPN